MNDYRDQIQAARDAARKVAETDALRQMVEEMSILEKKARLEEQRQQAGANFLRVKAEAKGILAQGRPAVEDWRSRFVAVMLELEKLLSERAEVEQPILQAGRKMRLAAQELAFFSSAYAQLGGITGDDMSRHWKEIGGADSALSLLPEEPPSKFFLDLQAHLRLYPYMARDWHRFF